MSGSSRDRSGVSVEEIERYVVPRWPQGPFNLEALDGGFTLGPCWANSWEVFDDGSMTDWRADGSHPINLRVRMQAGDLLYANDGDVGPMTYRIVPVLEDGVTSDPSRPAVAVGDVVAALASFGRGSLTRTVADLERGLTGKDSGGLKSALESQGVTGRTLEAGLIARDMFGRLNDIVHAVAITVALPLLLEPGEIVESVSLAAGNSPDRPFDLSTNRRIAEFKLSRWDGHDTARKLQLAKDLVHLAADESGRRAQLFVLDDRPFEFVSRSASLMQHLLKRFPGTLQMFESRFGDPAVSMAEFRSVDGSQVELIDLRTILGHAIAEGT